MTSNEKIVLFLQRKNELLQYALESLQIPEEDRTSYIVEADLEEIRGWSTATADRVWDQLLDPSKGGDMSMCPWCLLSSSCISCSYGKRHSCCFNEGSTYGELTTLLRTGNISSLSEVDGMDELADRIEQDETP